MTIDQLRKEITVTTWFLRSDGIIISYNHKTNKGFTEGKYLELNPEECARQLSAIDSIESWTKDENGLQLRWEEEINRPVTCGWKVFCLAFKLSQWEALTLAIRHEYELSLEQDSNMMNITDAVNKLNQNG